MDKNLIAEYRSRLPLRVTVQVENTADGLWAEISAPDKGLSHCYTQGSTLPELIIMINDAILTHFEIPEEARELVGFYIPVSEKHLRWETMFNQLVALEKKGSEETVLTLQEPQLA